MSIAAISYVRVPPPPYEHVGTLQYIDRHRNILTTPDEVTIAEDQMRARADYLLNDAWRYKNLVVRDLADHAPINYVTALT